MGKPAPVGNTDSHEGRGVLAAEFAALEEAMREIALEVEKLSARD